MKAYDMQKKEDVEVTADELIKLLDANRQVDLVFAEPRKDEDGYLAFCTFNYVGEDSDYWFGYCRLTQPNLLEGEPDFFEELLNCYSEKYYEIQSAFPEEGMALLDVLPEKWNTVTISRGVGEEEV